MKAKQKIVHSIWRGAVKLEIWENVQRTGVSHRFSYSRPFGWNSDGEKSNPLKLSASELVLVVRLAMAAHNWLNKRRQHVSELMQAAQGGGPLDAAHWAEPRKRENRNNERSTRP